MIMKTSKKSDLLELQGLYVESQRAHAQRKKKLLMSIEKIKNRVPEHLAQRVEDCFEKGRLALVAEMHGTCGGCHLMLPGGVANVLAVSDGFFECENCGSLVYWESFDRSESLHAIPNSGKGS